jgi:hypothetical protein
MKDKNVVIGMKVVPHRKSIWCDLVDSTSWQKSNKKYLYVNYESEDGWCLDYDPESGSGDFFLASDFEPYLTDKKQLRKASKLLLESLKAFENMTTEEFMHGADKDIREKIKKFLGISE